MARVMNVSCQCCCTRCPAHVCLKETPECVYVCVPFFLRACKCPIYSRQNERENVCVCVCVFVCVFVHVCVCVWRGLVAVIRLSSAPPLGTEL